MSFIKWVFVCFVACDFSSSLQSVNKFEHEGQHTKGQVQNACELLSLTDSLTNAHQKYFQKNNAPIKIKCKQCHERELSINEFEGGLMGWALKAITKEDNQFEKIKSIFDKCIELLSKNATSAEIVSFMVNVSNDMKQICSYCHGTEWERA
jgi:hypothetical protein